MENTPQSQPDDMPPEPLSTDRLIEQRQAAEAASDDLLQQIVAYQNDELKVMIDQVVTTYNAEGTKDYISILLEHGKGIVPDAYLTLLQAYIDRLGEQMTIEAVLRDPSRGDSEFAGYVRNEARRLLAAIDPRQLRADTYPEKEGIAIDAALAALKHVVDAPDMTEEKAHVYYDRVEQSRQQLEALRVFYEGTDTEQPPERASTYTLSELRRAHHLNTRYRQPYHRELHPDDAVDKLLLPTHHWQVELNDDQRHHLERYLRTLDGEREIDRLGIEGLELLPFATDELAIRNLLRDVPAIAFEGVEKIVFRTKTAEEAAVDREEMGEGWVTQASHGHDLRTNQADITVWVDPLARQLKKRLAEMPEPTTDAEVSERDVWIENVSMTYLKGVLIHEFGHAFHTKLPVSLLHQWDALVQTLVQEQAVSEYVEQVQLMDADNYYVEDFAESFKLCLLQPEVLQARSLERYAAMSDIISATRQS